MKNKVADAKHPAGVPVKCLRCGYDWEPKKNNPKTCPKCKSYMWPYPLKSA